MCARARCRVTWLVDRYGGGNGCRGGEGGEGGGGEGVGRRGNGDKGKLGAGVAVSNGTGLEGGYRISMLRHLRIVVTTDSFAMIVTGTELLLDRGRQWVCFPRSIHPKFLRVFLLFPSLSSQYQNLYGSPNVHSPASPTCPTELPQMLLLPSVSRGPSGPLS